MSGLDPRRIDGLTQLKSSETRFEATPDTAALEVFGNSFPGRPYRISFDCPEFTSLCPVTGQPDFGAVTITYIPGRWCVESKSLKLFLFSFRNHNTFHEEAVNLILDKLMAACSPVWAEVLGEFRPRGGIAITVRAQAGTPPASGQ